MKKSQIISILLMLLAAFSQAQVRYYRQLPELALSSHFKVEVKQGASAYKEIYTYQLPQNAIGHVTKNDQFASFGFNKNSGSVQIKVTRKDGVALTNSNSALKNKTYDDVTTSYSSGALIIDCPSDKKHLYVSVNGKTEFPLMIFVDAFADTPIPAGAKVVTFTARNTAYVQNAQYDRYTVPNDVDAVVIEDGALIKGTIHVEKTRTKPLLLTGRGMVLGKGEVLHGAANIPYNAVVITKSKKNIIENIMVVNSRHFSVDVGDEGIIDNIKMYGYDSNNDGIVGGDNSVIKNVFSKVNDDHIKLYNDNMKVQNCTFWVQQNGALFQLAWNSVKPGDNCLVENCEVLAWEAGCGDPKLGQGGVARTFVNLRESDSNPSSSNLTVRNVYVQGQLDRFIGINGKYGDARSLSLNKVLLENITLENKPNKYSWIYTGNSPYSIDFTFKNVKVAGQCLSASNYEFKTEGNVKLIYQGCATTPVNQSPTISLGALPNNALAPANVTLSATASDTDGSIANVKFYNGATLLNTDNSAPYSFVWNDVAADTYQIKAVATDNDGATTSSTVASLTVAQTPVNTCTLPANAVAQASSATCNASDGKITFTFDNVAGRTYIRFSIDGGNTYFPNALSNSGSFVASGLAAGTYNCFAMWGNGDCPTRIGNVIVAQQSCPVACTTPGETTVSKTNASCNASDGKITFAFNDTPGRTGIKFSIDGGASYSSTVSDASSTFSFDGLSTGNYDCSVAWGNDDCATSLGSMTVGQNTCNNSGKPTAITDLALRQNANCGVVLTWSDVNGETAYRIRRKTAGQNTFINLADVNPNSTSYVDNTVAANVTYTYQVRPVVNNVAVEVSNLPSITTNCAGSAAKFGAFEEVSSLYIYPSPATDFVSVEGIEQGDLIQVFSTEGILMFETSNDNTILVSGYPTGVYIIKTQGHTFKFIKE